MIRWSKGSSVIKISLILTVALGFAFFIQSARNITQKYTFQGSNIDIRVEAAKRSLTFGQDEKIEKYSEGKTILYRDLTNCSQPGFLDNFINPCWKSEISGSSLVCAARIMLLGFHKSGTSDLTKRFGQHNKAYATTGDYFLSNSSLSTQCPMKWLEDYPRQKSLNRKKKAKKIGYNDCPGCVLVSKVIQENTTFIIRQSAIQYLQYTMVEESRYIITMREPADRMISHFFYVHKVQRGDNPYANYTIEQIGNAFFHDVVSESITSLIACLKEYGTTVCVLESKLSPLKHPNEYLLSMITIGCYSIYLKEVLKFIPKERIYFSKLEDYSKDEAQSMKRIYRFVGLPVPSLNSSAGEKQEKYVRNAGYGSKPVLSETKILLRKFYQPFNIELANILGDKKWLWR